MRQCNPSSLNKATIQITKVLVILLIIMLTSCVTSSEQEARELENGIVFVAPRGSNPLAQSIAWSPVDENRVLIMAYETPERPAEIFVLDIQSGEKDFVAGPLGNAQFIEAKWMPDGSKVLVLAVDTKRFEPSGWWAVDVDTKSAEYLMNPVDTVAWSPDGKTIAALQREIKNDTSYIQLKLIDVDTKVEQVITNGCISEKILSDRKIK